jgi:hypothetical protein
MNKTKFPFQVSSIITIFQFIDQHFFVGFPYFMLISFDPKALSNAGARVGVERRNAKGYHFESMNKQMMTV